MLLGGIHKRRPQDFDLPPSAVHIEPIGYTPRNFGVRIHKATLL